MAKILVCAILGALLWVPGVHAATAPATSTPAVAPVAAQSSTDVAQAETAAMKAQLEGQRQALLDAPDGVFGVEYKDGVLSRLKLKATMEVSTSLRGARADRMARENAMRKARAAFSTFLNSNVVFVESGNEGVQITEKDKVESAQYTEASASSINVASQSFQRGLIPIFQECDGEGVERQCIAVLGWSQKLVKASETAQSAMKPTPTEEAPAAKPAAPADVAAPAEESRGRVTKMGDMDF